MPGEIINQTPAGLELQAARSAKFYLQESKRDIDKLFGDGYAARNPELVSAMIRSASADFTTAILSQHLELAAGRIADAVSDLKRD